MNTNLEANDLVITNFFTHNHEDCVEEMLPLCGKVGRVVRAFGYKGDDFVSVVHGKERWNWPVSSCEKICNLRDVLPEEYS